MRAESTLVASQRGNARARRRRGARVERRNTARYRFITPFGPWFALRSEARGYGRIAHYAICTMCRAPSASVGFEIAPSSKVHGLRRPPESPRTGSCRIAKRSGERWSTFALRSFDVSREAYREARAARWVPRRESSRVGLATGRPIATNVTEARARDDVSGVTMASCSSLSTLARLDTCQSRVVDEGRSFEP